MVCFCEQHWRFKVESLLQYTLGLPLGHRKYNTFITGVTFVLIDHQKIVLC